MKKIILSTILSLLAINFYAQQKRIYLGIDDHTDFMWTANNVKYDSVFVKMLDYYLEQIDSTRSNPDDFQMRFNCDGSYWMQAYQRHRTTQQFERLISAIKSGHVSVPLNALINCYGGMPTEAAIRGMYYAGHVERKYDVRFKMAGSMENNTLPLGMSSIWAGSGAKYSWYGIGGYGSQMPYEYRENRRHQLYYYTGLDGSSILMKWYDFGERKRNSLGSYAEVRTTMESKDPAAEIGGLISYLEGMCDTVSVNSEYPFNSIAAFGYGHDDLETYLAPEVIQAAKNGTTENTKVRVSILEDFYKDIEKNYPNLPSESVTYGNEWDLLPASMNETTAKMRRSTERLRGAEALAAVVCAKSKDDSFMTDLSCLRNNAWDSFGYYWEHDWTGDSKVAMKERPGWQVKLQQNLTDYVDTLQKTAAKHLGNQIRKSDNTRFFVFNPLSWTRSDVADFEWDGEYPVKILDLETEKEVPSQLVSVDNKNYIRIFAEDIPSVGYKVFEIKNEPPAEFESTVKVSGDTISNPYYNLRLSRSGAITSIVDKCSGNRELVKFIEGRYLNDLGNGNVDSGKAIEIENAGPVSITLKAHSNLPAKHCVRVTLYANNPRIEIQNRIEANFRDVKTWAFSFNLNNPTTRHEELGAVITAKTEINGGHYSSRNARYDWQTFNHFADLSENDYGVTVSNLDCSFFQLGRSSVYTLDENASQINALAGGRIDKKWEDGGYLGFPDQNGESNFRYHFALLPHRSDFDAVRSMKFSLEHQNPLICGKVTGGKSASKQISYSLLSVSDSGTLVWSIKPAEEGIDNGIITRIWNLKNEVTDAIVKFNIPIKSAWKTTHIETNLHEIGHVRGKIPVHFNKQQINTFRLISENAMR